MLQIIRSQKVYDVCIIGSGAAGGGAAKVLTEGGLEVVMLEAGPLLDPAKHFSEHKWPYQLPHRGAGIGGSGYDAYGSRELDVAFISGKIPGEPYTNAPDSPFGWDRARILGGRTNHFTRVWLRMATDLGVVFRKVSSTEKTASIVIREATRCSGLHSSLG
jgi:choline dehydrogenase-like flavoprotein